MKILLIILMAFVLQGCVHATYNSATGEKFKVTSVFKSVDGLAAQRGDFKLKVDSTHTQDPAATMVQFMALYRVLTEGSNE